MRNNKMKLSQVIDDAVKKAGGKITVKRFARFQLGGE